VRAVPSPVEREEHGDCDDQECSERADDECTGNPPPVAGCDGDVPPGATAANSPSCMDVVRNVLPQPEFCVLSGVHDVPLKRSMTGGGTDLVPRNTMVRSTFGRGATATPAALTAEYL
jgi:hypothetical protein